MILTGHEIKKQVKAGRIHIKPFLEQNLNPNSYNFRLGKKIIIFKERVLDLKKLNNYKEIEIPKKGLVLQPNTLYLSHTLEEMGSDFYVPIMQARSSVGRLGLYIYLNSGLGDIGFKRQWTLELNVVQPLRIYPETKVGQMLFWVPIGKIKLYNGKYKNSVGPEVSQIWRDFMPKK